MTMNDSGTRLSVADLVSSPRQTIRDAAVFIREHARDAVELAALAAGGILYLLLAQWTGPRTGSIGEAQMIRILEAGAQTIWIVLLPLGAVRLAARTLAGRGMEDVRFGRHLQRLGGTASATWGESGQKLLACLLVTVVASSAAVTLTVTYDVVGWLPQTTILVALVTAGGIVGDSLQKEVARRAAARRESMQVVATRVEAVPLPATDVEAPKGLASRGRSSSRGLPEGVVTRGEFFARMAEDLREAQREERAFALLVVGLSAPGAGAALPIEHRSWLGDSLTRLYGGDGLIGYLGNDLFGVELVDDSAEEILAAGEEPIFDLLGQAGSEVLGELEPQIGVASPQGRETARVLYAQALECYQNAEGLATRERRRA